MSTTTVPAGIADPVTLEVLKNAFGNLVDQMGQQLLRTCHSFVIYSRDFSSSLCDATGATVMQGSEDIAVHVGTGQPAVETILRTYEGRIAPGDIFLTNDPYTGGTHFCDVRVVRPVFVDGELFAFTQCVGHWADVGGAVPGSFNLQAREYFAEGLRITPVKIYDAGEFRDDVARLITANMRLPEDRLGDLHAQVETTAVGEHRLHELIAKYGRDTVRAAFGETQSYVERMARAAIAALPDGTWTSVDHIDSDPDDDEGLVPIRLSMTIRGDEVFYDLTGSHPTPVGSFLNATAVTTASSLVAGTKAFLPDLPLNSGIDRVVHAVIPEGSVVGATAPTAVTGFCTGVHEKVVNLVYELWSAVVPERAMACSFNIEYLLIGGWDHRSDEKKFFMWYDWLCGGWGGRRDRDGCNGAASVFGVGLAIQQIEAQERLSPVVMSGHEFITDSGGPGEFRGGLGVQRGCTLTDVRGAVVSYAVDRARSLPWGIEGGQPSLPVGVVLNPGDDGGTPLGSVFTGRPIGAGDHVTRPSGGGGGLGDPLDRDPARVLDDVIDDYVSLERAAKDYGVVVVPVDPEVCEYRVDDAATTGLRDRLRRERAGWLDLDPAEALRMLRAGEIDELDLGRRHGVVLDAQTGEVLPRTTEQFRAMLRRRMLPHWTSAA